MNKIPVVVLSGFLGSGKTTLLLRLIEEAANRKLQTAVLMNELGLRDVDGGIVSGAGSGVAVEKLLDGCICCSKKDEVAQCMELLLQRRPDVILIELTGVANPEEIADSLTEPAIKDRVYLKQIITLLDAEHVLEYNSIFSSEKQLVHTLRRQIETADLLVVNKTDLVKPAHLDKVRKAIAKQNAASPIWFTAHSRIELQPVFEGIEPAADMPPPPAKRPFPMLRHSPSPAPGHSHASHQHGRVRTITIPLEDTRYVTSGKLEAFLSGWGTRLLRAKGYIRLTEDSETYLLQYAGKRAVWQPSRYNGDPYLVLIGLQLEPQQVLDQWQDIFSRL